MKKNATFLDEVSLKKIEIKALLAFIIFLISFSTLNAQVSQSEFDALKALYKSTNGDNWTIHSNWDTTTNNVSDSWYGLTVESSHVTTIDIRNNNLIGTLPAEIGNFPELTNITISGNSGLSGSIPSEIGNLSKLKYLFLYDNNLSGNIPSSIGNLTNLNTIWLQSNQLTGSIPSEIGNITNLQELLLYFNQLTGNIPVEIFSLSFLTNLNLHSNNLSGNIPEQINNLTNVSTIGLQKNRLTGQIPSTIGELSNLTFLYLNDNQLSGYIPASIGNLSNLKDLYLSNNQIGGNIPDEICNLTHLQLLQLGDNQLIGAIPKNIGNLSSLQYFNIYNNKLRDSVPESIKNLTNLSGIELYDNQLTYIPDLTSFTNTSITIHNNNLVFRDIEPNVNVLNNYSPQAKVGKEKTEHVDIGTNYTLSVDVGGSSTTYQWYKNNNPISGANSETYQITNFQLSDEGNYHCQMSNSVATSLILQSYNVTLTNSVIPEISVDTNSLNFGDILINNDSIQELKISGTNLSDNIQVSVLNDTNYTISTDNSTYSLSLELTQTAGTIDETTIYVKFNPKFPTYFAGEINFSSSSANEQIINLSGKAHEPTVDLNKFVDYNIIVYPNPSTGIINIKNINDDNYNITIMDINGRIIYHTNQYKQSSIDLSNQTQGIYFIKITTRNKIYYSKIIKE